MLCPKGHESEDSDFCSVCGAKMAAADTTTLRIADAPTAPLGACPDCGTPRQPVNPDSDAPVFCEDCGYNFTSGAHGELKAQPPVLTEWEVAVAIDPSLKTDGSPDPPADFHPSTMMLMGNSYLIGRRSDKRGVFPEISLDSDDAVSHRHALLNRMPDGGIVLRDVGSSNGTWLNGAPVQPLLDTPLKDGDVITVGHWTRLALRKVS